MLAVVLAEVVAEQHGAQDGRAGVERGGLAAEVVPLAGGDEGVGRGLGGHGGRGGGEEGGEEGGEMHFGGWGGGLGWCWWCLGVKLDWIKTG